MTTGPQTAEPSATSTATSTATGTTTGTATGTAGRVLPCTRRALLARAGAGGAALGAVGLLAACGGTGEPAGSSGGAGSASGSEGSSSSGGSGGAAGSVAAADVPEGSAVVVEVAGEEVVLAQPSAGQYVAYSAVCTHAGGIVQPAEGTEVRCPLHGSVFDTADGGAVLQGPAASPLPSMTVTQEGDQLLVS